MRPSLGQNRVPRVVAVVVFTSLVFCGIVGALASYEAHEGPSYPIDFSAFYCGAKALSVGADPYRVEPLRTCERETSFVAKQRMKELHILPAPLPPYALLALTGLSRLPFSVATQLWLALNIVALGSGIAGVATLSGLRPTVVALAMFASAGFASLVLGQLVPIVLAAVVYAAPCARRGQVVGAAIGVGVASLEPHLALPAWCALALFEPRSRIPLGVAAALIVSISLFAGPALTVEYVTEVLPQHARSELYNFPAQYSHSSLLAATGVSGDAALRLGSLSYGIALAGGSG